MNFVLNPIFFPTGTNLSLKVRARMEDKGRIKNLKSLLAFFGKFGRVRPLPSAIVMPKVIKLFLLLPETLSLPLENASHLSWLTF